MPGSHTPHTLTGAQPFPSHARDRLRAFAVRHGPLLPARVAVRLTLPRATWTVPLARRLAQRVLRHPAVAEDARTAVEIALTEACSNAVQHADPAAHYSLRLHVEQRTCLVEVADGGAGFDVTQPPPMPSARALSGRGLALIGQLADQLVIQRRQPTGMLVRFVKHLTV